MRARISSNRACFRSCGFFTPKALSTSSCFFFLNLHHVLLHRVFHNKLNATTEERVISGNFLSWKANHYNQMLSLKTLMCQSKRHSWVYSVKSIERFSLLTSCVLACLLLPYWLFISTYSTSLIPNLTTLLTVNNSSRLGVYWDKL